MQGKQPKSSPCKPASYLAHLHRSGSRECLGLPGKTLKTSCWVLDCHQKEVFIVKHTHKPIICLCYKRFALWLPGKAPGLGCTSAAALPARPPLMLVSTPKGLRGLGRGMCILGKPASKPWQGFQHVDYTTSHEWKLILLFNSAHKERKARKKDIKLEILVALKIEEG